MAGPLAGIRVIEIVGIGPCPLAAMMLADMGAEVIRIDRMPMAGNPYPMLGTKFDIMARGRQSLAINLKHPEGRETALGLIEKADALLEGFRPGVMEKLGLAPDVCLDRNEKLVYCRVTGWGQEGPLAKSAGHDLNYLALSGVLASMGRPDTPPVPPLNLIGDGGGGILAAFGVVCGLLEARTSGKGQVIDAAMLDSAVLMGMLPYMFRAMGQWNETRGENRIDGGAHFYDTYECADGKWIAIGPIEPQFYALLCELCGMHDQRFKNQTDASRWPELKVKFALVFKQRTRQEWCDILEGTDACFSPVLDLEEAPRHPHNIARHLFIEIEGVAQPSPAPRFSRSIPQPSTAPAAIGQHSDEILRRWNIPEERIAQLKSIKVI